MSTQATGTRYALVATISLVASALGTGAALAQSSSQQTLTINATVASRANLVISPTTINFPDANPQTTPSIAADSTVSVTAQMRTAGTPTLKVLAAGDLAAGGNTIAVSNVTWTASPAPFSAGTMNKTTAQNAAAFSAGGGSYAGTYTFSLANNWAYAPGSYTTTATYTLTAP